TCCTVGATRFSIRFSGHWPRWSRFSRRSPSRRDTLRPPKKRHEHDPPSKLCFKMSEPTDYEVIIVGGGPAGSTAAAILAEHGHRVLVLEREQFPRYHIGESLLPFTFHPLKRLGLLDKIRKHGFVKKFSVQFVS